MAAEVYAVACPVSSAYHFHILIFSLAYLAPVIVLLASPIFQFYAVKKGMPCLETVSVCPFIFLWRINSN